MKAGDKVLIAVQQGGEHWIYASVVSTWPPAGKASQDDEPGGALVLADHPGNMEHGRMLQRKRAEIRTKADLEPLLEEARQLPQQQVISGAGPERRRWVEHYQHQMSVLD